MALALNQNSIQKTGTSDKTPKYIRYTPSQQGEGYNSGSKNRIIRLYEAPNDPMEPAKFKHKKLPSGSSSPPVPVMHSPPRRITAADQQNWKIPPCISNWKNVKGYTIPLDKRLAADGQRLQESTVNEKFAKLSEALYLAERNARTELEIHEKMKRKIVEKQRDTREAELRNLASRVRQNITDTKEYTREQEDLEMVQEQDQSSEIEREQIRAERKREHQRELAMEARAGMESGKPTKRSKAERDKDRDIGEQIALGSKALATSIGEFDERLFNQTGDREYQGLDSQNINLSSSRKGPVQFEKEDPNQLQTREPQFDFGLDKFMDQARAHN